MCPLTTGHELLFKIASSALCKERNSLTCKAAINLCYEFVTPPKHVSLTTEPKNIYKYINLGLKIMEKQALLSAVKRWGRAFCFICSGIMTNTHSLLLEIIGESSTFFFFTFLLDPEL